jgi:hypothetical protein
MVVEEEEDIESCVWKQKSRVVLYKSESIIENLK